MRWFGKERRAGRSCRG